MDVAIPFKRYNKLNDDVQQFNIFFDPNENSFDTLIEFVQMFQEKQINIEYRNGIEVKTASALSKIGDNVFFRLRAEDLTKVDRLREKGCKFFFDSSLAADGWIMLNYLVEKSGVREVYICNDLVYELDKVCAYCHKYNVKVRFIVNRVPLTNLNVGSWIAPIYRPQDMSVLKTCGIDVIEFDCGNPCNFDELKVLYKVYVKKQDWYGQLGELNSDLKDRDIPCRGISWMLADKRSKCGLRCLHGGKCHTCRDLVTVAQDLRDIGVQLVGHKR